jgi:hypothetical protein
MDNKMIWVDVWKHVVVDIAVIGLPVVLSVVLIVGMVAFVRRTKRIFNGSGASATPIPKSPRHSLFMDMRIARPTLDDGEAEEFEAPANRLKGGRKIVGRLTVTDSRIIFTPARLYFLTRGNGFDIDRRSITGIQVRPPGGDAMKQHGIVALMQPQIEIRGAEQTVYLVVRNPREVVNILNGSQPGRHAAI